MHQPARALPKGVLESISGKTAGARRPEVLVLSHERSGTHFLINSLGTAYGYSSPNFVMFDEPVLTINYFDPKAVADAIAQVARRRDGAVIKSHHAAEFFESSLAAITRDVLLFYVYRDPVDVMISFWRFMHRWPWREGPRSATAVEFALSEPEGHMLRYQMRQRANMLQRWAAHVDGWTAAARHNRRLVLVRYEDLRDAYVSTIGGLSALIGNSPASTNPPDPNKYVIHGVPPESLPAPDRDELRRIALAEVGDTMRRLDYA